MIQQSYFVGKLRKIVFYGDFTQSSQVNWWAIMLYSYNLLFNVYVME